MSEHLICYQTPTNVLQLIYSSKILNLPDSPPSPWFEAPQLKIMGFDQTPVYHDSKVIPVRS